MVMHATIPIPSQTLSKILRKVVYRKVPEGWIKEIVDFS